MLKLADFPKKKGNWDEQSEGQVYSRPPTLKPTPEHYAHSLAGASSTTAFGWPRDTLALVPIVFPVQEAAPLSTMQQAEARLLCP
jgi:hypothetical protein